MKKNGKYYLITLLKEIDVPIVLIKIKEIIKKNKLKDVIKYINSFNNYHYISGDYKNNKSKLLIRHLECGKEWEITFSNFKKGRRCPYCKKFKPKNSNEYFINNFKEMSDNEEYEILEEYKGIDTKIKIRHKKCKNIFSITPHMLIGKGRRCPYCFKKSTAEKRIYQYLKNHNIEFKSEYSFDDLLSKKHFKLRFDFAIFKDNKLLFLLEYDGKQHFKESGFITKEKLEYLKYNDKLKDEYCKKNKIKLIRINYKDKRNIEKILSLIIQRLSKGKVNF